MRTARWVYGELMDRLVRGIPPGSRISIDGMSRELGVSQTPVREALTWLESEGLVVRTHLAGFRSPPMLTLEQIDEVFTMRVLLEPYAAKLTASRCTDELAEELRCAVARRRAQAKKTETTRGHEFPSEDACLHDLIAERAGNAFLRDTITKLHVHVHLHRVRNNALFTADAVDEHDEIVAAIVGRQPLTASRAMRNHVRASHRRAREAFGKD